MSYCKFHREPKVIWNISYRIRCKVYIIITKEVSLRFHLCRVITRSTWRVYRSFIRLAFNSFSSSRISNERNSFLQQANHELCPVQLKKDGFCVLFWLFHSKLYNLLTNSKQYGWGSWVGGNVNIQYQMEFNLGYFIS